MAKAPPAASWSKTSATRPQVEVHEQVVGLVDAAGLRVLHGQHAVGGLARLDRGKQVLERLARQRRHLISEVLEDRLLAVRAVLALERDLARHLGAVLPVLADGGGVAPQLSSFWCSTQRSERVRGSNPAMTAVFSGIPVYVSEASLSYDVGNKTFENINHPNMPDRQNWTNKLSYTEWWTNEIEQGLPWKRIKKRLEEKYL